MDRKLCSGPSDADRAADALTGLRLRRVTAYRASVEGRR